MTILKNGTLTGFQDRNGKEIKTADRIKHRVDGSILTIDKFARAVSRLGFKYDLLNLNVSRGMNPDGTYFARLTDYELTDDVPAKPEGSTVSPGDDAQNMVPDTFRDPEADKPRKHAKKKKDDEQRALDEGVTVDQERRILAIQDFQDEELCDELRDRGYRGEITKTKTIKI